VSPLPSVKDAAWQLHNHGYCVVPKLTGQKRPSGDWKAYQAQRPTDAQMSLWFDHGKAEGFCVITGAMSGNVEMLELEGRAVTDGTLQRFEQAIRDAGLAPCFERVTAGLAENSPSGGIHWLYRVAGTDVAGNTKLAAAPDRQVLIETRGEGGLTICAPSTGHPSGGSWHYRDGCTGLPATITADEYQLLHEAAKALDLSPVKAPQVQATQEGVPTPRSKDKKQQAPEGEISPWDDYNQRGPDWGELLSGWELVSGLEGEGECRWRRPGDTTAEHSATTDHEGSNYLYAWSTSTMFEAERPYTKAGVYAVMHHGDNFAKATKALRNLGYGTEKQATPPSAEWIALLTSEAGTHNE
jgi:putative DNA primase/helicase